MPSNKLRILVVDDNDDDLFIIEDYLSRIAAYELQVDKEINYQTARKRIFGNAHDIYLIDYLLGADTGLDLIRECVSKGIKKPFILLTGKGDQKIDIEASKVGVYDYLTKSELNAEQLERSFRYSMERYASYTAIEESEKRYREIFTKSNDIIFALDSTFRLINFNPAVTVILGYQFEELIGQPIDILFAGKDDAEQFIHRFNPDLTGGDFETVLLTKGKLPKTFLASLSSSISGNGLIQYQGILHDYTSIKKSVTRKLLNARIEASNKIVRSLAHEIRNPLTNINLSSHQLEKEVSDDTKIFIDIILRNSKKINDLISQLMNVSNPVYKNSGRFGINEIMRLVLTNATDRIRLKEIEIIERFYDQEIFISGDSDKMQMALLNIIINAVEAMENGTGRLEVETSVASQTADIIIRDNGAGIPPENLPHLFQPFFTGKKNGMGLGLAIAHSVIRAHNGVIEVDSEQGQGTTFTIKLKTAG